MVRFNPDTGRYVDTDTGQEMPPGWAPPAEPQASDLKVSVPRIPALDIPAYIPGIGQVGTFDRGETIHTPAFGGRVVQPAAPEEPPPTGLPIPPPAPPPTVPGAPPSAPGPIRRGPLEVAGKDVTAGGGLVQTPESKAAGEEATASNEQIKKSIDAATTAKKTFITETKKAEGIVAEHNAQVEQKVYDAEVAAKAERDRKQAERDAAIAAKQADVDKAAAELESSRKNSSRDLWDDMSAPSKIFAAFAQGLSAALYGYQGGYKPGSAGVAPATAAFQRLDAQDRQKKLLQLQNSKDFLALQKSNKAEADAIYEKALDRLDAEKLAKIGLLKQENTAFAAKYKNNPELAKAAAESENAQLDQEAANTRSQVAQRELANQQRYEKQAPQTVTHYKAPEPVGGKSAPLAGREDVDAREKARIAKDTLGTLSDQVTKDPKLWAIMQEAERGWGQFQKTGKIFGAGPLVSLVASEAANARSPDELVRRVAERSGYSGQKADDAVNLYADLKRAQLSAAKDLGGAVTAEDQARIGETYSVLGRSPAAAAKALRGYQGEYNRKLKGYEAVKNFNDQPTAPAVPRITQAELAAKVKQAQATPAGPARDRLVAEIRAAVQ